MSKVSISVVIPARNEARSLPRLLPRLTAMPEIGEIIVADGGSSDETVQIARKYGAQVVEGAQERGPQQNLGADAASSEILWFLHADCWPDRSCGSRIVSATKRGVVGGHFRLRFEGSGLAPRVFERIAGVQARFGVFYGDSGLWTTKAAFEQLGGFQNWPLFEDYDLARRLRALGRIETLPARVRASNRRFRERPYRTLRLWFELQIRFRLGQSPHELARLYRERSG